MKKPMIFITIFIIILIAFFIISKYSNVNFPINLKFFKGESNKDNFENEESTGTISTNNNGGEETASADITGEETAGTDCSFVKISYSMKNFQQEETCNEESGGICINKDISCSVEIHNLDYESGGAFVIENFFLERGIEKEIGAFDIELLNVDVPSREFSSLSGSTNVAGNLANTEVNCYFNTVDVPVKETCD